MGVYTLHVPNSCKGRFVLFPSDCQYIKMTCTYAAPSYSPKPRSETLASWISIWYGFFCGAEYETQWVNSKLAIPGQNRLIATVTQVLHGQTHRHASIWIDYLRKVCFVCKLSHDELPQSLFCKIWSCICHGDGKEDWESFFLDFFIKCVGDNVRRLLSFLWKWR